MSALRQWRLGLPADRRSLSIVARTFGVSKVELYRWETGKRRIPPEKVPAISAITGIPMSELRPDVFRAAMHIDAAKELLLTG